MEKLMRSLNVLISAVLILDLVGCGTILYPERRGQRAGHIDAGVAVLDGLGLLFFLIPGVIAFAVDFSNGTIYLPATSKVSLENKDVRLVKFDPDHTSAATIEQMIKNETGQTIKLSQDGMTITKLKSTDEVVFNFNKVLPEMRNMKIALVR